MGGVIVILTGGGQTVNIRNSCSLLCGCLGGASLVKVKKETVQD